MPQYHAPGVYIEEKAGAKPIEGVGTATGAFVGIAEKGPIGEAKLITNWTQFVENFGSFIPNGYLAYAINQFFTEGGTRCYVVRTCHYDDTKTPVAETGLYTLKDRAAAPQDILIVEALSEGSWSDHMWIEIDDVKNDQEKFKMVIWYKGSVVEGFEKLTVDDITTKVNGASKYIKVKVIEENVTSPPENRPAISGFVSNDLKVTALDRGLTLTIETTDNSKFNLKVYQAGILTKDDFKNLTMTDVEQKVNSVAKYIKLKNLKENDPQNAAKPDAVENQELPFYGLKEGSDGLAEGVKLKDDTDTVSLQINAFREGVEVQITNATSGAEKFKVIVKAEGKQAETPFDELTMDTVESEINGKSGYIEAIAIGKNRPANQTIKIEAVGLKDNDFIGDEKTKNGLHAFDPVDDINIVAIPDWPGDREVILLASAYCKNRKDCFFVADPPIGLDPVRVLNFKEGQDDYAGNAFNSSYAALYYPWVYVTDPLTGGKKLVPPSGAVAGTYSSTDVIRGVHKAPAGIIDGYLDSAVGIERIVTKGEQELLNPEQINVIRSFPGTGIVIWGARTLSADPEWKYINVRRLLLYIEESIEKNTQWVVFEPNNRALWGMVKRDVSAFLTIVWRTGALFGATEEEAFFVKIDDENNPQEIRDAGQLIIDIGVAPTKPAEFVIFRIAQKTQTKK